MDVEPGATELGPGLSLTKPTWLAYSLSVEGEGHRRKRIPCQDASAAGVLGGGRWAYAIVADGHGSVRHFRSDRGARIAVDVLRETFEAVADQPDSGIPGSDDQSVTPAIWSEWAAGHVVARWRSRVWADLLADPPVVRTPTTTEPALERYLQDIQGRDGYPRQASLVLQVQAFRQFAATHVSRPEEPLPLPTEASWDVDALGGWQASAYGTTLLGVLVGPEVVFVLQQGDGAMVEIREGLSQYLVPPPEGALGNATPSMCNDDAVHEILATTRSLLVDDLPTGIVVTTDGIPNSYTKIEGFFDFCSEVAAIGLREPGLDDKLVRWLPEISARGSRDDVSIALLLELPRAPSTLGAATASTTPAFAEYAGGATDGEMVVSRTDASDYEQINDSPLTPRANTDVVAQTEVVDQANDQGRVGAAPGIGSEQPGSATSANMDPSTSEERSQTSERREREGPC